MKEQLEALGFEAVANTPAEFGTRIKAEMRKWAKVIHDAKHQGPMKTRSKAADQEDDR